MALVPGDLAPDFILDSVLDGKVEPFKLSSAKSKYVILMFYPVDFGYVTPTEFYSLEPLLETFSSLNCLLLAISTEHTTSQIQFQAALRAQAGLNFMKIRLASDPVGDVAKKYSVYKEEENICYRGIFIIDPEGKIITMEKCDFPVGCSMEEQLRQVQAAITMEGKSKGGTPADWEMGEAICETGFSLGK
eukprot:GFUD01029980.1.p2 GENE.GFUD01029980.1~~GFUD01029980.1.p2  ORF type:complete len:190 (+),score=64.20 GFUD01029980.1:172-741(+)